MRELTKDELELISGGYDTAEIVVTADGGDDFHWDWGDSGDWDDSGGWNDGGDTGSDGGDSYEPPANEFPCENSAVAALNSAIATKDANDGKEGRDEPEYGATIAKDANGNFVTGEIRTGQSYAESDEPQTVLGAPAGYPWTAVVASVHSHPPSGSDFTDDRNKAPSDGDWESADEAVRLGADPSVYTMYIIDKDGTMRAFDYMTRAERGATAENPSGTQTSAEDGRVVDPSSGSCG